MSKSRIEQAADLLAAAKHTVVFSGAGISMESGIPPFRGPGGLWNHYDPSCIDMDRFLREPRICWKLIKEIFYDFFGQAKPNPAHYGIGEWERLGLVKTVITQNIDNLHQEAGSLNVLEFHGTSRTCSCQKCGKVREVTPVMLQQDLPLCECLGVLKPDFVFFGEGIPAKVSELSFREAALTDLLLVIGTTGEVMPACRIPFLVQARGVKIIEINPNKTAFSDTITDIHIQDRAGTAVKALHKMLDSRSRL